MDDDSDSSRDRDTSPDPITLPSSPLSGRKPRITANPKRRATPKRVTSTDRFRATPAKSIVLDTPHHPGDDASPWRIKVTVQAEPRDVSGSASPGKRKSSQKLAKQTTTMTVPLKSSSPAKKADGNQVKRPTRKRRGTPMREKRSAPQLRQQQKVQPDPEPMSERDVEGEPDEQDENSEAEDEVPLLISTPPRRASGRMARLNAQYSNGTGRTKRLSVARDELDQALQDAMMDAPGDVTLSRAEDFTMVSMESLQSAKEASLAHISHNRSAMEKSALTVSYMPSSPPKQQSQSHAQYPDLAAKAALARSGLGSPFEPTPPKRTNLSTPFQLKSTTKSQSSLRDEGDPMSWKPSGPLKLRSSVRTAGMPSISTQIPRNSDGQPSAQDLAEAYGMAEDLWQEDGSREVGNTQADALSISSRSSSDHDILPENGVRSQGPEAVEDLFAHLPDKPLRSKIPRTWRRSSGMDFSYVDSPAHDLAPRTREERRQSTDGSGVLTPPSTDESEVEIEEDNVTVELQDEADDQLRSEYTQMDQGLDGEMEDVQHDADEQLQSEFTQPEGEATRYQENDGTDYEEEDGPTRNDSKSPLQEAEERPGEDDTGEFFSSNMPQVFAKPTDKPKRRPARKPTMDLAELLNLDGSPQKATVTASKNSSPVTSPQILATQKLDKPISSPLRKSLLRSSKIGGDAPYVEERNASQNNVQRPDSRHLKDLRDSGITRFESGGQYPQQQVPQKRRGRTYFGRNHPNNSQTESTVTDSFGSIEGEKEYPKLQETSHAEKRKPVPMKATQDAIDDIVDQHANHNEDQEALDDEDGVDESDEEETAEAILSYQENLNLESPGKIKVNFNDSQTFSKQSSWFDASRVQAPLFGSTPKQHPPLFENNTAPKSAVAAPTQHRIPDSSIKSQPVVISVDQKKPGPEPGLFARLHDTFWSAIMRSTAPAERIHHAKAMHDEPTFVFPSSLRTQIRSRYGVLSESHTFTMAHIRTLHRMLNSISSGRSDTVIPKSGPVPTDLKAKINKLQTSVSGYDYLFSHTHAYVVFAFLQTLVPRRTVESIKCGEVDFVGDEIAVRIREYFDPERHGEDFVWHSEEGRWANELKGQITSDFVVRALGDCVRANDALLEKLRLEGREGDYYKECFGLRDGNGKGGRPGTGGG